jgi:hypothetical protein
LKKDGRTELRVYGNEATFKSTLDRHIKRGRDLSDEVEGVKALIDADPGGPTSLNAYFLEDKWCGDVERWRQNVWASLKKHLADQAPALLPNVTAAWPPNTGKPRHARHFSWVEPWLKDAAVELEDLRGKLGEKRAISQKAATPSGEPRKHPLQGISLYVSIFAFVTGPAVLVAGFGFAAMVFAEIASLAAFLGGRHLDGPNGWKDRRLRAWTVVFVVAVLFFVTAAAARSSQEPPQAASPGSSSDSRSPSPSSSDSPSPNPSVSLETEHRGGVQENSSTGIFEWNLTISLRDVISEQEIVAFVVRESGRRSCLFRHARNGDIFEYQAGYRYVIQVTAVGVFDASFDVERSAPTTDAVRCSTA